MSSINSYKMKRLYDATSELYDVGTYDEFSLSLEDEEKRRRVHAALSAHYNVGEWEDFNSEFRTKSNPDNEERIPSGNAYENDTNTNTSYTDGNDSGNFSTVDSGSLDNSLTEEKTSVDNSQDVINQDAADLLNSQITINRNEDGFYDWYSDWASRTNIHPDPNHEGHNYDWYAAYQAGAEPTAEDGSLLSTKVGLFGINDKDMSSVKGLNFKNPRHSAFFIKKFITTNGNIVGDSVNSVNDLHNTEYEKRLIKKETTDGNNKVDGYDYDNIGQGSDIGYGGNGQEILINGRIAPTGWNAIDIIREYNEYSQFRIAKNRNYQSGKKDPEKKYYEAAGPKQKFLSDTNPLLWDGIEYTALWHSGVVDQNNGEIIKSQSPESRKFGVAKDALLQALQQDLNFLFNPEQALELINNLDLGEMSSESYNAILQEFGQVLEPKEGETDEDFAKRREPMLNNIVNAVSLALAKSGGDSAYVGENRVKEWHWPDKYKTYEDVGTHPLRVVDGQEYIIDVKDNQMTPYPDFLRATRELYPELDIKHIEEFDKIYRSDGNVSAFNYINKTLYDQLNAGLDSYVTKLDADLMVEKIGEVAWNKATEQEKFDILYGDEFEHKVGEFFKHRGYGMGWLVPNSLQNMSKFDKTPIDFTDPNRGGGVIENVVGGAGESVIGLTSTLAGVATSGVAALGGLAWELGGAAFTDKTIDEALQNVSDLTNLHDGEIMSKLSGLTRPDSQGGIFLSTVLGSPFASIEAIGDSVGQYTFDSLNAKGYDGAAIYVSTLLDSSIKWLPWAFPIFKGRYNAFKHNYKAKTGIDLSPSTLLFKNQKILTKIHSANKAIKEGPVKTDLGFGPKNKVGKGSVQRVTVNEVILESDLKALKKSNPEAYNLYMELKNSLPEVVMDVTTLNKILNQVKNSNPKDFVQLRNKMAKELGISPGEFVSILNKNGIIKFDFMRYTSLTDKPWFASLKRKLGFREHAPVIQGHQFGLFQIGNAKKFYSNLLESGINVNVGKNKINIWPSKQQMINTKKNAVMVNGDFVKTVEISPGVFEPITTLKPELLNSKFKIDQISQITGRNANPLIESHIKTTENVAVNKVDGEPVLSIAETAQKKIEEKGKKVEKKEKETQLEIVDDMILKEESKTNKESTLRPVKQKLEAEIKDLETKPPASPSQASLAEATKDKPVTTKSKSKKDVPDKLYHGKDGKVVEKSFKGVGSKKVYDGGDNPMTLLKQMKKDKIKGAEAVPETWADANKFIADYYKGEGYDFVKFSNESRPQLGGEYIHTPSGQSLAVKKEHAQVYANQRGRDAKYKTDSVGKLDAGNATLSQKPTKIKTAEELGGQNPVYGLKINNKDLFIQKKPLGSGGTQQYYQLDKNGNVVGDALGKDFAKAINKLKRLNKEKGTVPEKKTVTREQVTGAKTKSESFKEKLKKEDKAISSETKEIAKYKNQLEILSKNRNIYKQQLQSGEITKSQYDKLIAKNNQRDVIFRSNIKELKNSIEEKTEMYERATKTKEQLVKKADKLEKKMLKMDKKSTDYIYNKRELESDRQAIKDADIILNRLNNYKPRKNIDTQGLIVYSSIVPPIPPQVSEWIKNRIKKFKTKVLTKQGLRDLKDALAGKENPSVVLPETKTKKDIIEGIEGRFIESIRRSKYKIWDAKKISMSWRQNFPEEILNDAGAMVEGIGRVDKKGDTITKVEERDLSGKTYRLAESFSEAIENQRVSINEELNPSGKKSISENEYIVKLENYLPHLYTNGPKKIKSFINKFVRSNTPNAKKRLFPTLKEAVDAGLIPKTQNVADLFDAWVNVNWQMVAGKKIVNSLKESLWYDDKPILRTSKDVPLDDKFLSTSSYHFSRNGKTFWYPEELKSVVAYLEGYNAATIPEWIPLFGGKSPMRGYDILNGVQKTIALSFSLFHFGALWESSAGMRKLGPFKSLNPLGGFGTLGFKTNTKGEITGFGSIKSASTDLLNDGPFLQECIMSGLQIGNPYDPHYNMIIGHLDNLSAYIDRKRMTGNIANIADILAPGLLDAPWLINKALKGQNKMLWDGYHTPLKVLGYYQMTRELYQKFPGEDTRIINEWVAKNVNTIFGGIEWENSIFRDPTYLKMMNRFWFSFDWTSSAALNFYKRIYGPEVVKTIFGKGSPDPTRGGGPNVKGGPKGPGPRRSVTSFMQRRNFRNMLGMIAATTISIQAGMKYFFGGDDEDMSWFPWNNEKGKKTSIDWTPVYARYYKMKTGQEYKGNRVYFGLGKQVKEVLRLFNEPNKYVTGKVAPLGMEITEQLGSWLFDGPLGDYASEYDIDYDYGYKWDERRSRLESFIETFQPFSMTGTSFAWTFPVSTGMTYTKALDEFTGILNLEFDPQSWSGLFDETILKKEATLYLRLAERYPELIHAMEINKVDPIDVITNARHELSNYYYDKMFLALQDNDEKGQKRYLNAYINANGTWKKIRKRLENNQEMTQDDIDKYERMFNSRKIKIEKHLDNIEKDKKKEDKEDPKPSILF